jgi:Ran GTPase-activating protein (RanGAP) involved in mRNA processing and transport
LDLGGNALGDAGITSLADALAANCSLRHLFLSTNQITAVGLGVLLHSLQYNHQSALVELFLFGNKIGDDGAQLLSDFMLLQYANILLFIIKFSSPYILVVFFVLFVLFAYLLKMSLI